MKLSALSNCPTERKYFIFIQQNNFYFRFLFFFSCFFSFFLKFLLYFFNWKKIYREVIFSLLFLRRRSEEAKKGWSAFRAHPGATQFTHYTSRGAQRLLHNCKCCPCTSACTYNNQDKRQSAWATTDLRVEDQWTSSFIQKNDFLELILFWKILNVFSLI